MLWVRHGAYLDCTANGSRTSSSGLYAHCTAALPARSVHAGARPASGAVARCQAQCVVQLTFHAARAVMKSSLVRLCIACVWIPDMPLPAQQAGSG
jgi:hypothetical protein